MMHKSKSGLLATAASQKHFLSNAAVSENLTQKNLAASIYPFYFLLPRMLVKIALCDSDDILTSSAASLITFSIC